MEVMEKRVETRPKVEHLPGKCFAPGGVIFAHGPRRRSWTELNVFPSLAMARGLEPIHQFGHLVLTGERIAVVRKWKRNEAAAADPTANTAESEPIEELFSRRRCGVGDGLVTVGTAQSLHPESRMEQRSMWMPVDKPLPAQILQRIEFVNAHCGFGRIDA